MVKVTCGESGIQFEAKTSRTTQHPIVAALKADAAKRNCYGQTMEAMKAIRKAGGYDTVEQFVQMVRDQVNGVRKADAAAKTSVEAARKEAVESRKRQNALLRSHGYRWSKITEEDMDVFGATAFGDMYGNADHVWMLIAPDGREVSVKQALQEIEVSK